MTDYHDRPEFPTKPSLLVKAQRAAPALSTVTYQTHQAIVELLEASESRALKAEEALREIEQIAANTSGDDERFYAMGDIEEIARSALTPSPDTKGGE